MKSERRSLHYQDLIRIDWSVQPVLYKSEQRPGTESCLSQPGGQPGLHGKFQLYNKFLFQTAMSIYRPCTGQAEARGLLQIQVYPRLHESCLKKTRVPTAQGKAAFYTKQPLFIGTQNPKTGSAKTSLYTKTTE